MSLHKHFRNTNAGYVLIDDNIEDDILNKCAKGHPVLIGKPSSRESDLTKNSFIRIATITRGFDGVIEILNTYLKNIEHMTLNEIIETQKNMITHLSSYALTDKIINREYAFLKRYFKEGYADECDYIDTLDWLIMINRNHKMNGEKLGELSELLSIILKHFRKMGQPLLEEKVAAFQNILKKKES